MKNIVSVIIPVYNREQYIEECVASVFQQTHQDFEILLIDDGSTDGSAALCRKLQVADNRVIFLESAHGGVSAARNIGLDRAQGEYVFFLDSDDIIHSRLLETLVCGMNAHNAAISGTEVINVHEKNWHKAQNAAQSGDGKGEVTSLKHADALEQMLCKSCPLSMIGGVMMRRDLIQETRFRTDLFIGEDFYFIYENMLKGPDAVFLKQKWYYGRIHRNNSSWSYDYNGFWTRFYRRKLVWESEESFSRTEFAAAQKRNGLGVFLSCSKRWPPKHPERKKMIRVMREHHSVLFPALGIKDKLRFVLAVYFPSGYDFLRKIRQKLK